MQHFHSRSSILRLLPLFILNFNAFEWDTIPSLTAPVFFITLQPKKKKPVELIPNLHRWIEGIESFEKLRKPFQSKGKERRGQKESSRKCDCFREGFLWNWVKIYGPRRLRFLCMFKNLSLVSIRSRITNWVKQERPMLTLWDPRR